MGVKLAFKLQEILHQTCKLCKSCLCPLFSQFLSPVTTPFQSAFCCVVHNLMYDSIFSLFLSPLLIILLSPLPHVLFPHFILAAGLQILVLHIDTAVSYFSLPIPLSSLFFPIQLYCPSLIIKLFCIPIFISAA